MKYRCLWETLAKIKSFLPEIPRINCHNFLRSVQLFRSFFPCKSLQAFAQSCKTGFLQVPPLILHPELSWKDLGRDSVQLGTRAGFVPGSRVGYRNGLSPRACSTRADVHALFPAAALPSRDPAAPGAPGCQQQERGHRARRHRGGPLGGSSDRSLRICW